MGVILESSLLIATERGRFNLVAFLAARPAEPFFITAVTASELLHGCERATDTAIRERRSRFVEGVLQAYAVLPFALAEAREHARLWADLEKKGTLIGERDLLIASIAKATGHSVATLNRSEFERVPGLVLEEVG
ncbi:MAG: PIN domain-containing protein [Verrucomicrobia bacterium]|nr:PIN domain-containing protein [Verrucomicrobiota bacterium]